MFKRKVLIFCLFLSLTLIYQVKSYSLVKIFNSNKVTITTSDNALIAIKDIKYKLKKTINETITETLTDSGTEISTSSNTLLSKSEGKIEITNNLDEIINISVLLDGDYDGISLLNNEKSLFPGDKFYDIDLAIEEDVESGFQNIELIILAEWEDGSAILNCSGNIEVNEEKNTFYEYRDSRTIIPNSLDSNSYINNQSVENNDISEDIQENQLYLVNNQNINGSEEVIDTYEDFNNFENIENKELQSVNGQQIEEVNNNSLNLHNAEIKSSNSSVSEDNEDNNLLEEQTKLSN
jgi:hypothetical protein